MPSNIKSFQVFLGCPAGLENERRCVEGAIKSLNDTLAIPRGLMFVPIGAERTPAGLPRPRGAVNLDIRGADFFILIVHDRWRARYPGPMAQETEDVEEQYELAADCLDDPSSPVRGVAVLFKAIGAEERARPAFQLKQILDFKRHLESQRDVPSASFADLPTLMDESRALLASWLNGLDALKAPARPAKPADEGFDLASDDSGAPVSKRADLITEAKRLADAGRHAGAEACFALAVARADDPGAYVEYAKFLRRTGRLARAQEMLEKALKLAGATDNQRVVASACSHLGMILQVRGDLKGAERILRRCLALGKKQRDHRRQATTLGSIGLLLKAKGDLPKAELMMRRALAMEEKLQRLSGMANQYCNLGLISRRLGDLTRAETLLRRAMAIDEKLGRLEAVANQCTNIGLVLRARGRLDEAEDMIRRALGINETLGRLEGLASDYANLGLLYQARGNNEEAERLHLTSLAMEEQIGRAEGIARSHHSLGGIARARGDVRAARQHWTRSRDLFSKIGMPADAKELQKLLTLLRASRRGDGAGRSVDGRAASNGATRPDESR